MGIYKNIVGKRLAVIATCLCCLSSMTKSVSAQFEPLTITVLPDVPTTTDEVVIRHDLTFFTGGYRVGGSNLAFIDPFHVVIDVFISGPNPGDPVTQAITFLDVESDLGMLPAGDYQYTSRVVTIPNGQFPDQPNEKIFSQFPTSTSTGTFTVVPEPASLTLFAVGGWALTLRRRTS